MKKKIEKKNEDYLDLTEQDNEVVEEEQPKEVKEEEIAEPVMDAFTGLPEMDLPVLPIAI